MAFSANPLSLSIPEASFESWLRDSGYLEVLDQRTTQLHRLNSAATVENQRPTTATSNAAGIANSASTIPHTTVTAIAYGLFMSIVSSLATLVSVITINPLSKLTANDFAGQMPSWTDGFIGSLDSYSFPSSPAQAKMRVHENVKRFARNYAYLSIIIFACALYQMPLALVGLVSCLALWDFFRFCSKKWLYERFPVLRQVLVRVLQCAYLFKRSDCMIWIQWLVLSSLYCTLIFAASAAILMFSNLQLALFCAVAVSYAAIMLHSSFRNLTPPKQSPAKGRWR